MRKRFTAGLTGLCLLIALAGCGKTDDPLIPERNLPDTVEQPDTQPPETPPTSPEGEIPGSPGTEPPSAESPAATEAPAETTATADLPSAEEMFTERDSITAYSEADGIRITLSGTTATATDKSVQITGSTVVLTKEGDYRITGTLTDGSLIVRADAGAKLHLLFDGVQIHSENSAPLFLDTADKVFLTLAEGSENTLSNGGSFDGGGDDGMDGALFSRQDLTLNGTGSLTVISPAGNGIVSKDDLVLVSGTYGIQCAAHGLDANDSIRIGGGTLTVTAGKDGLHAENADDPSLGFVYLGGGSLHITAEGDGIHAGATLLADGGDVTILAGGGHENGSKTSSDFWGGFMGGGGRGGRGQKPGSPQSTGTTAKDGSTSMKGLKSAGEMLLRGGTFTIDSADDALHSDTSLTVSGGTFTIATGDDALHAEETLTVSGGTVTVSTSYEGLEAHHVNVSDGQITLVATDDGLNAAGGKDASGTTGGRDGMFGGFGGGKGGGFGGMGGNSDGSITISGGNLYINSSGDGLDANGTLLISGGHVTVVGPTQGDTATLDYDVSGTITGGTFIGTGASGGMAQSFRDSGQGVIAVSVGNQKAGTKITLTDPSGSVLLTHEPELPFSLVIFSSPELEKGETYTVTVGTSAGEVEAK